MVKDADLVEEVWIRSPEKKGRSLEEENEEKEKRKSKVMIRARIFKLLGSLTMDSKKSIPPAYVAGRPVRQPYSYSVPSPNRLFKNFSTGDEKVSEE